MKLKDWADKQGITYITAYRWFKDGTLPVEAYQTESGTIIVKDESDTVEKPMANNNQSSDSMSTFLKKTVEFSQNNSTVADFAAYILSNFSVKLNSEVNAPKYSKVKPKAEDIQKHFKQFMKPKGEKPQPNMFVAEPETLNELLAESENLSAQDLVKEINSITGGNVAFNSSTIADTLTKMPEMQNLIADLSASLAPSPHAIMGNGITTYDSLGHTGGVVVRNVDVTPQSINYTSSTNSAFGFPSVTNSINAVMPSSTPQSAFVMSAVVQPTAQEIEKAHQAVGKVVEDIRAATRPKRGRKPSKKTGKK